MRSNPMSITDSQRSGFRVTGILDTLPVKTAEKGVLIAYQTDFHIISNTQLIGDSAKRLIRRELTGRQSA